MTISRLKNPVQEYAWGSRTAISRLLGEPCPSASPQAELWIGAHPKAPSLVRREERWIPLPDWIEAAPQAILGDQVAKRFSNELPFLLKVLAAEKPLSIQAHPNLEQARAGYALENLMGIPLDAAHRNYRDDNHKPELICALTPFWALMGFRGVEQIAGLVEAIHNPQLTEVSRCLHDDSRASALQRFFSALMEMDRERQRRLVPGVMRCIDQISDNETIFHWMRELNRNYPADIGVLSPLFLNLIRLQPGEALYIPAGVLHSYLHGVGIELMANSDNVLRGGLTPKHVDVAELAKSLHFKEVPADPVAPKMISPQESCYFTPAEEFILSVIRLDRQHSYESRQKGSVEILMCTEGQARISGSDDGEVVDLSQGGCVIVPGALSHYSLVGQGTLFKASVPLP